VARLERIDRKGGSVVWAAPEGTHVRAVDLEVYSKARLSGLADAFGERVCVLFEGRAGSRYLAAFELHAWQLTEDQEIRRFVAMVHRLPPAARRLWNGAQSRTSTSGCRRARVRTRPCSRYRARPSRPWPACAPALP